MWGATLVVLPEWHSCTYFNPRAPCGARRDCVRSTLDRTRISIHAPRVGRDEFRGAARDFAGNFNPRAPCGARQHRTHREIHKKRFQSTRPVWGATFLASASRLTRLVFQSTRPVWGATITNWIFDTNARFQSTRPVWGATVLQHLQKVVHAYFNPRAPCGARRRHRDRKNGILRISIHAPRVGRDPLHFKIGVYNYISIHAPRVGRDMTVLA